MRRRSSAESFPVALALLGLAFIACALLVAGLPPLSGFVAKVALLTALLDPGGLGAAAASPPATAAGCSSGCCSRPGCSRRSSLSRAGIRHFWSTRGPARRRACASSRASPVAALLARLRGWLTVRAEPVLRYTRATAAGAARARGLHRRGAVDAAGAGAATPQRSREDAR